jgi:hypothetical protein
MLPGLGMNRDFFMEKFMPLAHFGNDTSSAKLLTAKPAKNGRKAREEAHIERRL